MHGWDSYYVYCAAALARLKKKTLYIGAGTGRYLNFLADQGIESYGIDISDDALALMAKRGITNVEKMDGGAMSFADESFPLVYLPADTVNYADELASLVDEACRVAGETVVIGSERHGTNSEVDPTGYAATMEWMGQTSSFIYTGYPWQYFQARLEANGFQIERVLDNFGSWLLEAHRGPG